MPNVNGFFLKYNIAFLLEEKLTIEMFMITKNIHRQKNIYIYIQYHSFNFKMFLRPDSLLRLKFTSYTLFRNQFVKITSIYRNV